MQPITPTLRVSDIGPQVVNLWELPWVRCCLAHSKMTRAGNQFTTEVQCNV